MSISQKISTTSGDSLPPFYAVELAAYSHYPYGMLQQGLYSEVNNTYRFGFNGMMRLDKVMDLVNTSPTPNEGVGNTYGTQFRLYDPRIAQWFSLDPLRAQFPWTSPYVAYNDNPVTLIDPAGTETVVNTQGEIIALPTDPNDNSVVLFKNGEMIPIGNFGGEIKIDDFFDIMLKANAQYASDEIDGKWFDYVGFINTLINIYDPVLLEFKLNVQINGPFDLKNRAYGNSQMIDGDNPELVFGLA